MPNTGVSLCFGGEVTLCRKTQDLGLEITAQDPGGSHVGRSTAGAVQSECWLGGTWFLRDQRGRGIKPLPASLGVLPWTSRASPPSSLRAGSMTVDSVGP